MQNRRLIHGKLRRKRPSSTLQKAVFRTLKGHLLQTHRLSGVYTLLLLVLYPAAVCARERAGDNGDGTFSNPVMWTDMPDPDVIRVGDDFYMVNTTMFYMPGAAVMHSKDLVNWSIVSYLYDSLHDTPRYDLRQGTAYGRGQWATSLRYRGGVFYAYFSPNDEPWRGYVFTTRDPRKGWKLHSRLPHYHDASLLFDDDGRAYVFYGTGRVRELMPDLTGVKPGGLDAQIFKRDPTETGLLEGSRAVKHRGKYYLLMVSWPEGGNRRQVCYRADSITGPWEKKVILLTDFGGFGHVGQGCIVDTGDGRWYAMIFQDRGAVGRVPTLMPCSWKDGWPMLGDASGRVPCVMEKPFGGGKAAPFTVSDDFDGPRPGAHWQWNHNPVDTAWTTTERKGWLRLKTAGVAPNIFLARNTLTQRMEGPRCSATVVLDVSGMRDGDVAGFSAFNGDAGLLSVVDDGGRKYVVMTTESVSLRNSDKAVTSVNREEHMRKELRQDTVYMRIDADFSAGRDTARFHYSLDGRQWAQAGPAFKMHFDYRRLFTGTRFAIYNYATKAAGGHVDVDWFRCGRQ